MKIAIIAQDKKSLNDINAFLKHTDVQHSLIPVIGDVQQIPAVIEQESPDLLLFEATNIGQDELQILGRVTSRYHDMGVIVLCHHQTQNFLMEAMRAGVREVVPTPLADNVLVDAIERFEKKIKLVRTPVRQSKLLAFIPCKGGCGSTFLATNIAYALAAQENKRVILIDFNLQFGDASLFVHDSTPKISIADVARQIQRLDGSFLASSVIEVLPNFGLLPAPEEPEKAAEVKLEHVKPLLQVAANHYDFVILDIGRVLSPISILALDQVDMIFPVLQQTMPFIRDGRRMINTFRLLGYPDDKIRLIVNRYNKKNDITLDNIVDTLKQKVFKVVPNDYLAVAESVNYGIPVTKLNRRSAAAKSIQDIALELAQGNKSQTHSFKKLLSF